ncbi:MAG: hypothetical protein C0490_08970 [Marivirga sp.]|nr:hypothetical protein [Marivirga sp.]
MKKITLALFAIFLSTNAFSQKLSDRATISVITCGPYQKEVSFAFGHSAFRVYDPPSAIDYAFNYGIFDFDKPGFILDFARGDNYYMLGVHDYQLFKNSYIEDNRYVHEQVLDLTAEQKQKIFDFLLWNAQPENRFYRYDYFYDNCATKIRDVIQNTLGNAVVFDGSYITTTYSIRQLTDIYLKPQPWGDLGIDICLGLPMDKIASPYEYMFLPDYVESGFDHASVKKDTITTALVLEKKIVYESREQAEEPSFPHPVYVFGSLAVIAIALSVFDLKRQKLSTWFDVFLFGTAGLIGVLLFLLWFFTDHKAAANNFNILWALPTHLVTIAAFRKKPKWLKTYFLVVGIVQLMLLVTWKFLPQQLNISLIPVVIALLARALIRYRVR